MSIREQIAINVIDSLQNQNQIKLGMVTRDPGILLTDLAATHFPAVLYSSGNETRATITQGGMRATRESMLQLILTVWVDGNAYADTHRNNLIEQIEKLLEVDVTRGGIAMDTQLVDVTLGQDPAPYYSMDLTFEVRYVYTRGQP